MPILNALGRPDPITLLMYLNLFQVSKLNPLISALTAELMARPVSEQWDGVCSGSSSSTVGSAISITG